MSKIMPVKPTFKELATEALAGDTDAAFQLAMRAPGTGFLPWLAKWVPPGQMTADVFDVMADSYHRMEIVRERERVAQENEENA